MAGTHSSKKRGDETHAPVHVQKRRGGRSSNAPIHVQTFLRGVDYPVRKQDLLKRAEQEGADESVLEALRDIPDREYESPTSVSREVAS